VKLGILKTDTVRPEWVPDFGEYPDMFVALLAKADPLPRIPTFAQISTSSLLSIFSSFANE